MRAERENPKCFHKLNDFRSLQTMITVKSFKFVQTEDPERITPTSRIKQDRFRFVEPQVRYITVQQ